MKIGKIIRSLHLSKNGQLQEVAAEAMPKLLQEHQRVTRMNKLLHSLIYANHISPEAQKVNLRRMKRQRQRKKGLLRAGNVAQNELTDF